MRRGIRVGDHLMVDDETGKVHYASDMVELWDGRWVHKSHYETRQPQEFVRALNDPEALRDVRPETPTETAFLARTTYIGATTVVASFGPADHIFDPGIGSMAIGRSFIVR